MATKKTAVLPSASPAKRSRRAKKTDTSIESSTVAEAGAAPIPDATPIPVLDTPVVAAPEAAIEDTLPEIQSTVPAVPKVTPTGDQVARRAYALYRRGCSDPLVNWLRAEREVEIVATRAFQFYTAGSNDPLANWFRAEHSL
jgi:hypothetical protein